MTEFEEKLSEALMRVAELDGVYPYPDEDTVCVQGNHMNDYILVCYLSQLIQDGDMEIKIRPEKIAYLRKLVKMEEEEENAEL